MVIWTGVWFVVAMSNFIASQLPEWAFLLLFWFGVFLGFASISIALEMRWQNWANSETPKLIIAKRIWNWVGSSLKLFTCVFAGAEAKSLVHHIPSESVAKIIQTHSPLSVWWSEKFTGLVIFFAFMAVLIVILKSQLFVISKSHYKRFGEH